jgi:hypothetical protein
MARTDLFRMLGKLKVPLLDAPHSFDRKVATIQGGQNFSEKVSAHRLA